LLVDSVSSNNNVFNVTYKVTKTRKNTIDVYYNQANPKIRRALISVQVDDKNITYNAVRVFNTNRTLNSTYYLQDNGSVTTTKPTGKALRYTGVIYNPDSSQTTPPTVAQVASGALPVNQTAGFAFTIQNGTSNYFKVGDFDLGTYVSLHLTDAYGLQRSLHGNVSKLTITDSEVTVNCGLDDPKLVLTWGGE